MRDDRGLYERLVLEGFQSGPLVAHDPAKARELPRRVRGLRHRGGRALRRARRRARLLGDAGIVRHRGKIEAAIQNARAAAAMHADGESLAELVWSHAPSGRRRAPRSARRPPGDHAGVDRAQQGDEAARLPLRRPHDRLRGHAGVRHRERSPRGLLGPGRGREHYPRPSMDERALTERLITYDTSTLEGMQAAAGFVKGWLEARDVEVIGTQHNGRPLLTATVGPKRGPTIVLHGHLDVVPGRPEQFEPRVDGDRLYGRGAYDMKGGLAAMICAFRDVAAQEGVRVHFTCVSDEESEEIDDRGSDYLVKNGYLGDFAITGEPTDLHIGIQAKGVLAMRVEVTRHGRARLDSVGRRQRRAEGDRHLPPDREPAVRARVLGPVRPARRSTSAGSWAATRMNKVPDLCVIDVDVRYLPGPGPRGDPRGGRGAARRARGEGVPPPSRDRGPRRSVRAGARRGDLARGGAHQRAARRGPRRRLGRDLVPRGGRARGGVRPGRRRPPRARGVGVDPVAQPVSGGTRGVRQPAPGPTRERR